VENLDFSVDTDDESNNSTHATTESRWTSSPATRSWIRFIIHLQSSDATPPEGNQGVIQILGYVLEATDPDPSGSAPDSVRAQGTKILTATALRRRHHYFMHSDAAPHIETQTEPGE